MVTWHVWGGVELGALFLTELPHGSSLRLYQTTFAQGLVESALTFLLLRSDHQSCLPAIFSFPTWSRLGHNIGNLNSSASLRRLGHARQASVTVLLAPRWGPFLSSGVSHSSFLIWHVDENNLSRFSAKVSARVRPGNNIQRNIL